MPKKFTTSQTEPVVEVDRVLISQKQLAVRVRELGREIQADFLGKDLVVVAILTGTVVFLADLMRQITLPLRLDFMGVSSYREKTASGKLIFTKELKLDVRGRSVLIVDDILDTGKTLDKVLRTVRKLKPADVKVCVLLSKSARRQKSVKADYIGFEIPDKFVVGYGLDFAEQYRNLPFIGVLPKTKKMLSR